MVAYGDGIYDQGMRIFDELAYRGSCDATSVTEAASRADCEPTIVARTPSELKTLLSQKIRQILAEKLALQHHQLLQQFSKVVLYTKLNLLMNNMVSGKEQF